MPSPFPGMDPYLEHPTLWPGFHALLISTTAMSLGPKVAPNYYIALEERTYVVATDPITFIGRPGVAAIGVPQAPAMPTASPAPVAVLERPVVVELPVLDQIRQRYLEIRDGDTHDVVTVIEVLSPTNKRPGKDRQQYERKRQEVLDSLTNLVEIDLLRAWNPMPMYSIPSSHYRILVSRAWERRKAQLYPFNVTEPIPEIPIPLREGEKEPTLALGELLAQIYDQVRYDLRIDYTTDPESPLDQAVAAWSYELLCLAGRR